MQPAARFLVASTLAVLTACDAHPPDRDGDGHRDLTDCNDHDRAVWRWHRGYVDADRDGYGVGAEQEICGGRELPVGYAQQAGDCDDTDVLVWQKSFLYPDPDGDEIGAQAAESFCTEKGANAENNMDRERRQIQEPRCFNGRARKDSDVGQLACK